MLNLYRQLISTNLNNTIFEELSEEWLDRISPEVRSVIISGFYNAGILTINLSDFNKNEFYTKTIRHKFPHYCENLYIQIGPIIQRCLRRMFLGFNPNLLEYKVVLFMEGNDDDHLEPVKFHLEIF
ncbi:hypothetical protein [Arcticibacter svalbardensis]|uniref:hypothetical protein n=1 Tax=Arcticibacter svalbardensis TaxID=1288027 RepID=UPI00058FEDDE|nr:hypothetical protein [Arcticibacter svalbardensis]